MSNVNIPVVGLVVPTLTDNTNWFLNAAQWNAYWRQSSFSITLQEASPIQFGLMKQANNEVYAPVAATPTQYYSIGIDINGDGNLIPCDFVIKSSYDNLLARLDALDTNYQNLLQACKTAGITVNAI